MRIAVDIMGGDYAPEATVKGAILALDEIDKDSKLVLIGDKEAVEKICRIEGIDPSVFEIIHSTDIIEMNDYPAKSFKKKPNASIVKGFRLLENGEVDGFASAGNTGAMMVGAIHIIKTIPGIIRPCITASIPGLNNKPLLLVDVGLNPDCKPDVLYQYGIIGSVYAKYNYDIDFPRVGLLNIGEEEEKGNLQTKITFSLMKETTDFNFIGNIEPNRIFDNVVDVLVCDGFIGNVVLKEIEAFYSLIKKLDIKNDFLENFNFVNYGGTPVLGINKAVVIGHGISNEIAIKNMILMTRKVVETQIADRLKDIFK